MVPLNGEKQQVLKNSAGRLFFCLHLFAVNSSCYYIFRFDYCIALVSEPPVCRTCSATWRNQVIVIVIFRSTSHGCSWIKENNETASELQHQQYAAGRAHVASSSPGVSPICLTHLTSSLTSSPPSLNVDRTFHCRPRSSHCWKLWKCKCGSHSGPRNSLLNIVYFFNVTSGSRKV